jgi:bisphosphoglycerate-independent phosphoglycerate mutase (AlkP superfamily)
MSNLIRWEPAREMMSLRDAMDRLFDDAFIRPLSLRDVWSAPAIDMYQTDDEIVGCLADIAPTMLQMLNLPAPGEMTGTTLLIASREK